MQQLYDKTVTGTSTTAAALAKAQALALAQAQAKAAADAKAKALAATKPTTPKPPVATKPATTTTAPRATTTAPAAPGATPAADPALAALNAAKAAQVKAQDLAWQEAQRLANEQKTSATTQAEQLAQEAYVSKMQQERVMPNIMAQSGLQGQGYTETTANNIGTSYQNALNSVNKSKMDSFSKVDSSLMGEQSKINQNKASIDAQYQTDLANYNLSKAKTLSSGTTTKRTTTKTTGKDPFAAPDVTKNPYGAVKDALASFAWDPRDPQGSRIAMENYLQILVTNKIMNSTQLKEYINQFMEEYYGRANAGGTYQMTAAQRKAAS